MELDKFKLWLQKNYSHKRTVQSRISNCKTIEKYEGNLDFHFQKDSGEKLLQRLSYILHDERLNSLPKHKIPIKGNIRTSSATFKRAAKLYMTFKKEK